MKKLIIRTTLAVALVVGYGCSGKKDSTEAAKDVNETKIDNEATANAPNTSEGDQKDIADYMVDLANAGRTEYELSKVAAERATNASVKSYAKEAVSQHGSGEKELKQLAQEHSVTLPTTLNKDSQDMLTSLNAEKSGKDFDKKYVDQMASVNDKAVGKAKGILEKVQSAPLKSFIRKLQADDEKHKSQADGLKSVL